MTKNKIYNELKETLRSSPRTILVTGGAGFIGSNLAHYCLEHDDFTLINIDKLTYAGNLESLLSVQDHPQHIFLKGDICDRDLVRDIFNTYQPQAVLHLAAESHVDRSIDGPTGIRRSPSETRKGHTI